MRAGGKGRCPPRGTETSEVPAVDGEIIELWCDGCAASDAVCRGHLARADRSGDAGGVRRVRPRAPRAGVVVAEPGG
jgi:hypothetical protein